MANFEGARRFTELLDKIKSKIEADDVNTSGSTEEFYQECRVLINKFSEPEKYLPILGNLQKRQMYLNNQHQLIGLAAFVKPFVLEQNLIDNVEQKQPSNAKTKPHYLAHILFALLMTYVNLTFDIVFNINYLNAVKYSIQLVILVVFVISLLNRVSEKVKLVIEIIVAVLISLIPILLKA